MKRYSYIFTVAPVVAGIRHFSFSDIAVSFRKQYRSKSSSDEVAPLPPPPPPPRIPLEKLNSEQPQTASLVEPTLEDLDMSIPQVDLHFMSELVNARLGYRDGRWQELVKKKEACGENAKDIPITYFGRVTEAIKDSAALEALKQEKEKEQENFRERGIEQAPIEGLEYDDNVLLIDCRTVDEISVWGIIEGAKVLPAHEMWEGFQMDPETFYAHFGFRKPGMYEQVIFYCQWGPRSLMAAQFASYMGWKNIWHFRDGYYNWAKQFNKLVRRWWEVDKATGNDIDRLVQMETGRELGREVAPEFNDIVDQELEPLKIDTTRSRGGIMIQAFSSREDEERGLLDGETNARKQLPAQ